MTFKDPEAEKEYRRKYYENRRAIFAQRWKEYYKDFPEKRVMHNILTRCNNKNRRQWNEYGGRGIKCLITEDEIKILMKRDNYLSLNRPTIDRIDNDGNYEFGNCRFIENADNISRQDRTKRSKQINQYTLDLVLIKQYPSIHAAARELKINHQCIMHCLKGHTTTGKGFIWRYNE